MGGDRLLHDNEAELGMCMLPGTRYGALQQDYTAIRRSQSSDEGPAGWVAAVLDGHGMLGELAAETAACDILEQLEQKLPQDADSADVERVMTKAFRHAHEATVSLYKEPPETYVYPLKSRQQQQYKLNYSDGWPMYKSRDKLSERIIEFGTTCTVAVVQRRRLTVANVGDSSAVIGRREEDGSYTGSELTVRHWGHNQGEEARIRKSRPGRTRIVEDGYLAVAAGRFAGYQLSMTRALGHNMLADFGIIPVPSVHQQELSPRDVCLILASDGVWDAFTAHEAVRLVMEEAEQGGSACTAAELLCQEAVDRCIDGPDGEADNTSACVILFKQRAA